MRKQNVSSERIEIRLTPREKELIKEYCAENHITVSEYVRVLCEHIFSKTDK